MRNTNTDYENKTSSASNLSWVYFLFFLLFVFFYDFVYFKTQTYGQWLAADYTLRIVIISMILGVGAFRNLSVGWLNVPARFTHWTVIPLFLAILIIAIYYLLERPLSIAFPETVLFTPPQPSSSILHVLDLSLGLILVAISEELMFRVLIPVFLLRYIKSKTFIFILSSLLFGLAHWAHGAGSVLAGFITGMVWLALVQRTKSVLPSIVSHYAANLWFFW